MLVKDIISPKKHSLSPHQLAVLGVLTPERFRLAVFGAFNNASSTGRANILYSGYLLSGGRLKLVAKLYQAKRNRTGFRKFAMFSTFHLPDGEAWRVRAKLPKSMFERSPDTYPSRPAISPDYNTRLKRMVSR